MADNIELNAGSGGSSIAAASVTFSDDTAHVQIVGVGLMSGSAESYVMNFAVAGAGAVGAGVQRITLASDDPAVAHLATIAGDTTSLDGKVTACNTGAVVISSGTITTVSAVTAISNALPAGDNNIGNVDIVTHPADTFVTEGGALGKGVLLQGDDGTDRTNVLVDVAGHLQIDVLTAPTTAVTGTFWQETQPVSGTVTANLSATDNAVLDAIAASVAGTLTVGSHAVTNAGTFAVQVDAALPAGTNAIGKLAANSGVDIGDVDVTSIAAGTNTIGGTISQSSSSVVYDGTTACTVKRASGVAATGTVEMVAAVPGYQIRVLALAVIATSATANTIRIHNDDADLLGNAGNPIPIAVDADGDNIAGLTLPWNPGGWFQTDTDNESLDITLSAAQDVIYCVTYIEVT